VPFVVDASVAAAWYLPDERAPASTALLERLRTEWAIVPGLFWFEIRNILVVNERRARITEEATGGALEDLGRLPIHSDAEPVWRSVLGLARRHRLTVYDAAYLELAVRLGLPLATLDRALVTAAKGERVDLVVAA
jgi:predicted nucleic acid-binding protein